MNARALLVFSFPMVFKRLSDFQIAQVQYVLDAAAINEDVQRRYDVAMRNAISSRIGNQVNLNPRVVARGDKINRERVWTTKDDLHIRLDFKQFIAPDALLPKSNNPDELEYLTKVKHALETYGIWLNLDTYWYNTKEHGLNQDPKLFKVWLSYGKNGRAIDAPLGYIGRHEILAAVSVGKGFYDEVYLGPVAQQFDKLVTKVKINLELGQDEHSRLLKKNSDALPGIVAAAELLGNADDLPELSIWNNPNDLLMKAREIRNSGDMKNAHRLLLLSLLIAKKNLSSLEEYEAATTKGAERGLRIAQISLAVSATIITVADAYALYSTYREVTALSTFARKLAVKKAVKRGLTHEEKEELARYVIENNTEKVMTEYTGHYANKGWEQYKALSNY